MDREQTLRQNWWERCACISRVFSKRDAIPLRETIKRLDAYQQQGIGAIEIFAPYHGGHEYGALDPYNFYIVDPEIGTMVDFLELRRECHTRGMALIIFINVGYAAMENGDFIKAQDDIRRGLTSRETEMFLWSDSADAPAAETFSTHFGREPEGQWMYSQRAQKYYWVKWCGFKNDVALPQYNFGSEPWREECKRILRFWMDTGIDGMIIDAPYCYAECGFQINNECITDIIREYPNQYIQPEGGGAAGESLARWITEAHYNSLQDYALCRFWDGRTAITTALETGETAPIEETLTTWRDSVVALGGTTYQGVLWKMPLTQEQRLLEIITIVTTGAIFHDDNRLMYMDFEQPMRERLAKVFKLCAEEPALRLNGARRLIKAEDGVYVFERFDGTGKRAIVALNFRDRPCEVRLEMAGKGELCDALSRRTHSSDGMVTLALDAYDQAICIIE